MSSWGFSSIWTKASAAWERSFTSYQPVQTKSAAAFLREIDEILKDAKSLVKNHRDFLSPVEYAVFTSEHRTYHWSCSNEKRLRGGADDDGTTKQDKTTEQDETTEQDDTLPKQAFNELASQARIADLLKRVKTFHTKVVRASHKATIGKRPDFPDDEPARKEAQNTMDSATHNSRTPRSCSPSQRPPSSSASAGFPIPGPSGSSSSSNPTQGTPTLGEDSMVTVCHIPLGDIGREPSKPGRKFYMRIVYVKTGDDLFEFADEKPHELEPDQVDVDDRSLAALYGPSMDWVSRHGTESRQRSQPIVEEEEVPVESPVEDPVEISIEVSEKTFEQLSLEID
ncbi:hypothetical protein FRC12_017747 [Ceratobasidium sp. 428]|nr:hypothetical protein FRC12_017747 [Ceratobasidium sp. 428]